MEISKYFSGTAGVGGGGSGGSEGGRSPASSASSSSAINFGNEGGEINPTVALVFGGLALLGFAFVFLVTLLVPKRGKE